MEANITKKLNKHPCELPDYVISYIFSKLSMKNMVKTSTLSKRWLHEWESRMDLNFDPHNMFDSDAIDQLLRSYFISYGSLVELLSRFEGFHSEFVRRIDQFMLHYQGARIRSLRLNFPLRDDGHNDVIDRLIYQGILKGVERIELLLSYENHFGVPCDKLIYKFSCTLLSESDSLKYLHLQKCFLVSPMDFSGFKKLTTLVLQLVALNQQLLISNCINLVDLTLKHCEFSSDISIISPTLRHLNITEFQNENFPWKIDIDALKLSSIECRGHMRISSIKAPHLSKFHFYTIMNEEIQHAFDIINASLYQLETLAMGISHSQVAAILPRSLSLQFQNLQQLEFFVEGACDPNMDYFWILDIVMVCSNLQKLFLTVRHSHLGHPCMVSYQREKREHAKFFHNELKYLKLRGCVCTIDAIELASHFLKNVNSLKQITFGPCDKFYTGAWNKGFDCCNCFGRKLIREMLKDEVNEQCQLIIL